MTRVGQLTDEALIKRAGHAGRNLFALAILMTLTTATFVFATIALPRLSVVEMALPFACLLAAAGFWILAVGAKRGNPTSVGIVMVVMSIQFLISLITLCFVLARQGQPNVLWLIIALLVIAALAGSRNVLLELKKRGLWEERFGAAKPSRNICIVGGTLLVVGYSGFMASLFVPAYSVAKHAKERAKDVEQARAFVRMIKGEEAEFMTAMNALGATHGLESIKTASSKADALARRVESLQSELATDSPLSSIVKRYAQAVQDWKSGLSALDRPEPDGKKAREMLESGDRLRTEATAEFDRKFASPSGPKRD